MEENRFSDLVLYIITGLFLMLVFHLFLPGFLETLLPNFLFVAFFYFWGKGYFSIKTTSSPEKPILSDSQKSLLYLFLTICAAILILLMVFFPTLRKSLGTIFVATFLYSLGKGDFAQRNRTK